MMAPVAIERAAQPVIVDIDATIVPQRIDGTVERVFERRHLPSYKVPAGNHNRGRSVTQCRKIVHAL
jgi:hypothetical protein